MEHKGTVRIETERLVLRRFVSGDAPAMYINWANDPRVTKFLMWPPHASVDVSRRVLSEWVLSYEKPDFYQWAITVKENGDEPIGSISVVGTNENVNSVEIGYCIGVKWWNQGITSEAFSGIIPFLFKDVRCNRIEASFDPHNPHSGLVMKKCGLIYEGTRRQAGFTNRGISDVSTYGILASDYAAGACSGS